MLLVHDFLERSAERNPGKIALIFDGQQLTYAEINGMTDRLAAAFSRHGVVRGDRIVLFLPNSVELVVGIFAALKANAVFVVLNDTMKADKLFRVLANCRAAALLTSSRHARLAGEAKARIPSLKFSVLAKSTVGQDEKVDSSLLDFDALQAEFTATPPHRQCIDQDLACLIYTSGSSGEPKGVMSTHANVVFAAGSIISFLHNVPEDIVICALPLSFDYGLYQLLMTFKFGGTLVLERSFVYAGQFLQRLETEKVTGLPGVPTIFSILLRMDLSSYDLHHIRYITNTAASLPIKHIRELAARFPQAAIYSMYGLTETKRTLYLPPEQLLKRPGSVGIAIPGTEVWLVDEQDRRLGPNELGELVIRGRHVMLGYWDDPQLTAQRFRPGPLPGERVCYSGDLFRMDEEGYFFFVGRKDDIIKCRGEKVAPKEVENVLYGLPGVLEAAVVGVPDPILGQAVKAFIVAENPSLTEKDVLSYCHRQLEDFMVPKFVVFRDSLPKSANGKIQKTALI